MSDTAIFERSKRRCNQCEHYAMAIIGGKISGLRASCSVPFDLTNAPVVISRHYIIPPGTNAPECLHWKAKYQGAKT